MSEYKITLGLKKLEKALKALDDASLTPVDKNRLHIDGTIQRFEFTFEFFWKLLKGILETKGVEVTFPRDGLEAAYAGHLIDDEKIWLQMLKDRNLTSQTYDEKLADEIYMRIKTNLPILHSSFDKIKKQFQDVQ